MSKKHIIGKRVRVQIGGEPPEEEENDAVVGDDVSVHVSAEDVGKYGSIVGERVELKIGSDIDQIIHNIMSTIQDSQIQRRDEIEAICREILEEKDQNRKLDKIAKLISMGAGIAKIAQFIMQIQALLS